MDKKAIKTSGADEVQVFEVRMDNTEDQDELNRRLRKPGERPTAEVDKPVAPSAEDLKELERFVVENDDLLELESRIGRFNIFDALGITRAEIRHSNFLAFILDPAESHGLGQLFLKPLLMDLLKRAPADLRPLSPIELDGTDLRGVEIRREWKNIDLLITCRDPRFAVVVENKVDSRDHSMQLSRYAETMKKAFPTDRILYIYLTPDGDEPSEETEETWHSYKYAEIHRIFKRVRATYEDAIGENVLVFLDHYLDLIGTQFMNDPKIDELCQRIYKNHRRALELIFDRAGSPASGVLADAEAVLQEDSRWHVFFRHGKQIGFVPKTWLEWLPPIGLDRKDDPKSWFVFVFELYMEDRKLDLRVEVCRMADLAKRREIIDLLIKEGHRFGFKHSGYKVTDNYTRVSGRERVFVWQGDDEPDSEKVRAAVKKKLDEVYPKLEGLPLLLQPLFSSLAKTN